MAWLCIRVSGDFKKDASTGLVVGHAQCPELAKVYLVLCYVKAGKLFTVNLEQHLICLPFLRPAGKCDCVFNFP